MSVLDLTLCPAERDRASAPIFLLLGESERDMEAVSRIRTLTDRPVSLAALPADDWNAELSPWPAKAVFKGEADFSGGGDATLDKIRSAVIPAIRAELSAPSAPVWIAGYSLAGLLAVYALYRLPELAGAVCCSGSLWYPGFLDYAGSHATAAKPQGVYLSLGDREKKSRNPMLSRVEDCTLALRDLLARDGISCTFASEPGNHFQDPEGRLTRGILWCLGKD